MPVLTSHSLYLLFSFNINIKLCPIYSTHHVEAPTVIYLMATHAFILLPPPPAQILATADDFGLVKLFEFPVTTPHAKHKTYIVR